MKFLLVLILILIAFAPETFGCFSPPEGLYEKHESQAKLASSLAAIFLLLGCLTRFFSNRKRLWVPLLFITSFTYLPAYLWHWGQTAGSCGFPEIVFAFRVWAAGMFALFCYELLVFLKLRKMSAT